MLLACLSILQSVRHHCSIIVTLFIGNVMYQLYELQYYMMGDKVLLEGILEIPELWPLFQKEYHLNGKAYGRVPSFSGTQFEPIRKISVLITSASREGLDEPALCAVSSEPYLLAYTKYGCR